MTLSCAGIVVIKGDQTVLVKAHQRTPSFPKGKLEMGETYLDAALRELQEETGITEDQITIVDDFYVDEVFEGNPRIRYFIGLVKDNLTIDDFTFDPDEVSDVGWFTFEEAYQNVKDTRKKVLDAVIKNLIHS